MHFPLYVITGGAMWGHMDLKERVWTIPSTKTGQEHRMPLSDAAMTLLGESPGPEHGDYAFPGQSVRRASATRPSTLRYRACPVRGRTSTGSTSPFMASAARSEIGSRNVRTIRVNSRRLP